VTGGLIPVANELLMNRRRSVTELRPGEGVGVHLHDKISVELPPTGPNQRNAFDYNITSKGGDYAIGRIDISVLVFNLSRTKNLIVPQNGLLSITADQNTYESSTRPSYEGRGGGVELKPSSEARIKIKTQKRTEKQVKRRTIFGFRTNITKKSD